MATINLTSTINSTGLTSDSISINILKSATVTTGGIARKSTTAVVGSKEILLAGADYPNPTATTSVYAYIKNAGTITLRLSVLNNTASNAEDEISLAAGAWTLFPWDSVANITVYQVSAGTTLIEHGVFA
jgi:hypothetical protein|tara:strand:+ start:187 stop:576 length:390 start_codon:yes stop_codon:yes gene_type:complete